MKPPINKEEMIYQTSNGKWTHTKTFYEFDDMGGAATDLTFTLAHEKTNEYWSKPTVYD